MKTFWLVIKYLLMMVVAMAAVILIAACVPYNSHDIPRQVIAWSEANVFKVLTRGNSIYERERATGSSFYIGDNNWITACHVMVDQPLAFVQSEDKKHKIFVETAVCDEEYDLAILTYKGGRPLGFKSKKTVFTELTKENRGKTVYGPGYPLGLPLQITHGHWQSVENGRSVANLPEGNFISAPGLYGDSGSPAVIIINGKVQVVGLRTAGIGLTQPVTHLSVVTTVDKIKEFLRKHGYEYNEAESQSLWFHTSP